VRLTSGGWLARLVRLGATQPLREPVASDDAHFLASKGRLRVASRTLQRMAALHASGQQPLLRPAIAPGWGRALWIHEEAPQIGDALMDLAPRSLLAERGIEVDLFAAPAIARLFQGDRWLAHSFSDPAALQPGAHDFVIATSHAAASLAVKRARLPRLPWVSLKGYYGAYDYHRSAFVARRLADLMQQPLDADALRLHARQKLGVTASSPLPPRQAGELRIAIAVGGVRDERRYRHWPEVVRSLLDAGLRPTLVLLGSLNGRADAAEIASAVGRDMTVRDLVARIDLHTTRAAIDASHLLLCADGGLMHLGLTTATPMLALFTSNIDPAWRLPPDFEGAWLRSATEQVSTIGASDVVAAALPLATRVAANLPGNAAP
jgi:heptosyltransferase-2